MASSFTSNTPQQVRFAAVALCKSPSIPIMFKFDSLSHFFTLSPPKHTIRRRISPPLCVVGKPHVSRTQAEIFTTTTTATDHDSSTRKTFLTTRRGATDERVCRKPKNKLSGSQIEDGKRVIKNKNAGKDMGFRRKGKVGSVETTVGGEDDGIAVKFLEFVGSEVDNKKKMVRSKKENAYNQVGQDRGQKGSKKKKIDAAGSDLKFKFDMCSKNGDVIGGIQLYEWTQREGIKIGQHHYSVLLYLCSSAAVGVVQPAKSGSGSRTLSALDVSDKVTSLNPADLVEVTDESSMNLGAAELSTSFSDSETNNKMELDSRSTSDIFDWSSTQKQNLAQFSNKFSKLNSQSGDILPLKDGCTEADQEDHEIRVSEDFKRYALQKGLEIYEKMGSDNIPMNEAALTAVARMAMSMGNGDMAFEMVKQMKSLGINPRLRSYGPALSTFCNNGDIDKAFSVEKHMLEHGIYPEEPELEALLKVSVGAGKGDKVYYLLHKLRTSVRQVSKSIADKIVEWFKSKASSRVGKLKWNERVIKEAIEKGGGGWHGQGWLGRGQWIVSRAAVGTDGFCTCCGEELAIIDLDPTETENFAESVASIAIKREKQSSFQKFQKWLEYYGPFEAVVDGANVGLLTQRKFKPLKVNAVVNGIRQKLPSKRWPLIILHNRRITGDKMNEPMNKTLVEKWKNADALYATPTGSNDDWYWLYAAIKFKCLIVTNDEMRDHTFQLLGNDFFPKWKERHQVRFSFSEDGPAFHMPPPYSVVIQESENGHWHIPIASEHDYEAERVWLCITRASSSMAGQGSATKPKVQPAGHGERRRSSSSETKTIINSRAADHGIGNDRQSSPEEFYKNIRSLLSQSVLPNQNTVLSEIEAAEERGNCVIDFQI
ncbi:proteinaceous RNase P 1, chloroplastic/mitochondrial-like isoform X2 [Tripterygium wilfordii]|uniref:proteinaceous RNase P 1, chloroplastic/mitochondrial-like isoform X2 n=1 Tax=Tripterygium wilfordii TaxID=458696 RepID=UPI0018F81C2B|nr:proteinaceous RNase P 1, chloroplastic/mitochondrial-like isoform X2 [Tripterygium wilfordii]